MPQELKRWLFQPLQNIIDSLMVTIELIDRFPNPNEKEVK